MFCLLLVGTKKKRKKRKKKTTETEKKKKKRSGQGVFFPGWDMPCWLCCAGFSWLLRAFKG
jgi:hypothetical protein